MSDFRGDPSLNLNSRAFYRPHLSIAAFGCIFSVALELTYHVWSPRYRQGYEMEDPLHRTSRDWDVSTIDDDTLDIATDFRVREENTDDAMIDKIRRHRNAHRVQGPWWRTFTWPYSTHKNLHGAAVNGVLAGENLSSLHCATCAVQVLFSVHGAGNLFR